MNRRGPFADADCETCGHRLLLDHDTDEDGMSYYTTTYCEHEHACEASDCTELTHESCIDCGLPVCKKHTDWQMHACPCAEAPDDRP